ncbi:MAG: hypothetical protein KC588_11645, partial [Nitrospira sp.]|nr:hypothetical protein [Nitrospira sp.]
VPSAKNPDLHAQGDMHLPTRLREDPLFFNVTNHDGSLQFSSKLPSRFQRKWSLPRAFHLVPGPAC